MEAVAAEVEDSTAGVFMGGLQLPEPMPPEDIMADIAEAMVHPEDTMEVFEADIIEADLEGSTAEVFTRIGGYGDGGFGDGLFWDGHTTAGRTILMADIHIGAGLTTIHPMLQM